MNQLDKIINQLNKLPLPAKVGGIVGVVVLLTVANFFLMIQPAENKIVALRKENEALQKNLAEKKEIADNLNERRLEMDLLDQKLQEALTELPDKKDIEELVAQLNDVGRKSGLEVSQIVPGSEASAGFFAKIPLSLSVAGQYHEIALFLQEIANLRRIVNVSNIKLTPDNRAGGGPNAKIILRSDFLATTFRFIESGGPEIGGKKP